MIHYYFHNMDINQFVFWFFVYSFCGWCMECVVIRRDLGYWENRGFTKMPFCIIYGVGIFIAYHLFAPIQNNYFALYIAGAIGATIFEYLTANIMLKLFGEVWWNYEYKKFNYKGIICLESTLGWGLLSLFIFGFFNNYIEFFIKSLNHELVVIISTFLVISYLVDFTYHFTRSVFAKREHEDIVNNSFNDYV